MRCPACHTYQPTQLERCFLCGEQITPPRPNRLKELQAISQPGIEPASSNVSESFWGSAERGRHSNLRSQTRQRYEDVTGRRQRPMPTILAVFISLAILVGSASATIFFLTRMPDDQRLLNKGRQELANGQYAFAVNTLTKATTLRPKDSRAFLALARAYVGIDQIDKAWDSISHAQQLGQGVLADPALASDLANYYRQKGSYAKATDLLRPLAQANLPNKRAELADLDALWGDEALRDGKLEEALRLWEEVRSLKEGSRYGESEARLSTIYQKLAYAAATRNEDSKALTYLSQLNYIAQNPKNYEQAASIYEREDNLDLAIEQIRKALSLDSHNQIVTQKLATLLTRRGKELMDQGDNESGYAYLQQAKSLDAASVLPEVTLRKLTIGLDNDSKRPQLRGEVWNPSDKTVNTVAIRAELWDKDKENLLWSKDIKLIDECVPRLTGQQSRPFEVISVLKAEPATQSEFRVYLNGVFYKSYPIGKVDKSKLSSADTAAGSKPDDGRSLRESATSALNTTPQKQGNVEPPTSPWVKTKEDGHVLDSASTLPAKSNSSAEERTMKDLDY